MTYDPLQDVEDEPLEVTSEVLSALHSYRAAEKAQLLPGVDTQEERAHLSHSLNELTDRLLAGIERNPSKLWVLTEFQRSLAAQEESDTEVREHFGMELAALMDIVGIQSSDGLLSWYLGGI